MSEVQNDIITDVSKDYLVITMTGRPPVRIRKSQWSIIAKADGWEGQYQSQSHRTWHIKVRQKENRYIVYGTHITAWTNERDIRVGYLADNMEEVLDLIHKVVDEIGGHERMANDCIADLPAEEI